MTERVAVLLYGTVVGHLERADNELPSFTYTDAYASRGRAPLSARLPIAASTYPSQRVEPFLRGLLPESTATLQGWAQTLDIPDDDVFAMLGEMGWDCPGAVQFTRDGRVDSLRSRAGEYRLLTVAGIAARLRLLQSEPASWTMPGEHWSLGGQQEKFALALIDGQWHEAHGSAATTHILKPGIKIFLHQALVEHVTMQAAAVVGVTVAASELIRFDDQWALVVQRFDRLIDGRKVLRLHQEDFCQALGRLPSRKYEAQGGPRLVDMARLVRRQLTNPEDDILALADFLAINLVTGAPDGHSKNISLLVAPDGRRWVAPLYDLATGLTYDSARVERRVALSIGGERLFSRIRRQQWDKAADVLGIDSELLAARVVGLAENYPAAFREVLEDQHQVPGADEVAERTLPALEAHCEQVLDRLRSPGP